MTTDSPAPARIEVLSESGWQALVRPRSIALLGASGRASSVSFTTRFLQSNADLGYDGEIFLVNPNRTDILGRRSWPDLESLPTKPEMVAINLPDEKVLSAVEQAILSGAKALMIHSGGFGERGAEGEAREAKLKQLCSQAGVAALGPNCLGIMSVARRSSIASFRYPPGLKAGPIAAISQSGSVASILMTIAAPHGLSFIASTGNEAVTTTEDLISHAIDDPEIRLIVAFIEALRRPAELFALAERAREAGKPIIVLKAGLTEAGGAVSRGHTGAIAGEGAVYRQAFAQAGIILVEDFDELAQTVELMATWKRVPNPCRIGMLGTSGGELGVITDQCGQFGVTLPTFAAQTLSALQQALVLPADVLPRNPVDAGTGFNYPGSYKDRVRGVIRPLLGDPSIDALAIVQGTNRDSEDIAFSLNREIMAAGMAEAPSADKPIAVIASRSLPVDPEVVAGLRESGVAVLSGAREGLRAIANLARYGASPARAILPAPAPLAAPAAAAGGLVLQHRLFPFLAEAGLPTPRVIPVTDAAAARDAVRALGGRAVMKIDTARVVHKSDVGGVALGVTPDEAAIVFERLCACLSPRLGSIEGEAIIVAEELRGVEFFVGAKRDPGFGAVVACGMGGRLVELLGRSALLVTPFGHSEARDAIERSGALPFLSGHRGAPVADLDGLANLIVRVGRLAQAIGTSLSELDLNPIIVTDDNRAGTLADARLILAGSFTS